MNPEQHADHDDADTDATSTSESQHAEPRQSAEPQQPVEPHDVAATEAQLWALTPSRRVLHWAMIPLLLAILVFAGVRDIARTGPWTLGWLFVLVALLGIAQQLRAVVAVWLDPVGGELVLFRAAGGALRARVRQVRRLDHGAAFGRYSARSHRPIRFVTDHGSATLSVFFPDPYDLATTLRQANPNTHINL